MANEKKVALITGANRGIGLETARQLGQKGITVVVAARTLASAEETASKLKAEGIDAFPVKLEVTSDQDRKAAVKTIGDKFGKLDILINNAGVGSQTDMFALTVSETTEEELQTVFGTNLFAVVAVTREFLPLLKKSDAGRIVNLSSVLGSLTLHADPNSPIAAVKSLAYDASKSALNAFTIHLAAELKDTKIKVNSAHPGWVKTDMGTDKAPMEIVDGAKTSVELALLPQDGPNGRFIHLGQELPW
ncbi:NAD(P)-dependent dehydrogenase (short-subunit alcohol dehydrogenase family) [Silvibacterium bohemicum]|uniref:NAD(P)-dependent dehydrogenase (Short-subunit alcohol dehydrogenase family) n=1 Tax=Silvibacterium bohemicum TaxID=1577686 RepID=A0A841K0C4_9BACT|nr:SDR family oxidoreductase [Silvibacterium bohemicum]MBB6147006.1 NAD(P)-dependent dehydrogenase (short-subunit alcohol dehydrogenase family) [Silvibacterium bohemicum]